MKNKKSILLIGGEGYIGNIVAQHLLDKGYTVTSYDNLIYNNRLCVLNKAIYKNYNFVYGDMLDSKSIEIQINKVDVVVLLAGLVGDPITKKYPRESLMINDKSVKNVINICSKSKITNLIFVSTCSNYGLIKDNELADENHELNPLSLYAQSKVSAEKFILSLKNKTSINPTILRFATAFGLSPRMRFDLTISQFTHEIFLGNELLVYDAKTWRPYCHVKDFARLIQMVIEANIDKISFETFNSGNELNNATKQMIVNMIIDKIPDGKVIYKEHGEDPRNYRVNFNKVKSILGFETKFSIEDGISELLNAMNSQVFNNLNNNPNLFGNYTINYKAPK